MTGAASWARTTMSAPIHPEYAELPPMVRRQRRAAAALLCRRRAMRINEFVLTFRSDDGLGRPT